MARKVVLVGHCGPDSSYLRMAVQSASKNVAVSAADDDQSLQQEISRGADLLLLNRVLECGFEQPEGIDLIRHLRQKHPNLKLMLVSNYPEAQQAAILAGALPGFGKRDIGSQRVKDALRAALDE